MSEMLNQQLIQDNLNQKEQSSSIEELGSSVRKRITSIDALRAVTLLGILLVHTLGMFGWGAPESVTIYGNYIQTLISLFLINRCNTVFGILFGVSFYLILRNPTYTTKKFVWRCFLLVFIGLFDKIFYTYDALMWYGICGMFLACFRNLPVKKLWTAFIIIYILNLAIANLTNLSELLFRSDVRYNRYTDSNNLCEVLTYSIWQSSLDYIRVVIKGPLGTLSIFLLGYCISMSGIIENLEKKSTLKNFLFLTISYVLLVLVSLLFNLPVLKGMGYLCGSFCYAILFLLIYYKSYPFFRFLEPYGKLGLTNYSMQGVVGVCLSGLVFIPFHWPFEFVLLTLILFYVFQVICSIVWLKYYKYGPFEWLWRCATARKFTSNKLVIDK